MKCAFYATDTKIEAADLWLDKLVSRIQDHLAQHAAKIAADDTTLLKEVVSVLSAWDRRADLNSRGGALFFLICTQQKFLAALETPDFEEAVGTILKQSRLAKNAGAPSMRHGAISAEFAAATSNWG